MSRAARSILDPSFRYVPAAETDIRQTFTRARIAMEEDRLRDDEGDRRQADTSEEEMLADQDRVNQHYQGRE